MRQRSTARAIHLPEKSWRTRHMQTFSRRTILTVACTLLAVHPAGGHMHAPIDYMAIAAALRSGELVILLRHGATFADQADTDPFNLDNVTAQRQLNEAGKSL